MHARVQKWGNSLALRIPKSYAVEAGLADNVPVEIKVVDGSLIVQKARPPVTLKELLKGVTDENCPGEWQTGPAVGKEAW
ncbi:MAG: AbrB/MazE/SpoVT family DNA-binding domain-containing protein [Gemmataceae bacterium]|nr:AbrB/MazE/SpoVT family DNA-binding domain-containing protein [Gemmataceae bacterium]